MDNLPIMRIQCILVMTRQEKGEGFAGQRIVVLPRAVVARARRHPLLAGVFPTDVGYFPRAHGHLRERPTGVDQAIFIYCVKGAGWCELAGKRFEVRAGELLVIPPDTPHVYGADTKRAWTIHWFHAKGVLIDAFLDELGVREEQPIAYLGEDAQLLALFEEVLSVLEHGYAPLQLLHASHAMAHLLATMIRRRRESWREEPDSHYRISRSIAYMKQHLDEPLRLDALAGVANLSRSQYTALFKEQTGYAPIDYFIRLKMHRACQLLDTTQSSVKVIAASLGYEDPLYFSRMFRAVNETSPIAYRRMRKG
jgi:AraC family transcriptional regulator of arabinose operon